MRLVLVTDLRGGTVKYRVVLDLVRAAISSRSASPYSEAVAAAIAQDWTPENLLCTWGRIAGWSPRMNLVVSFVSGISPPQRCSRLLKIFEYSNSVSELPRARVRNFSWAV